jgi:hypothetical protein
MRLLAAIFSLLLLGFGYAHQDADPSEVDEKVRPAKVPPKLEIVERSDRGLRISVSSDWLVPLVKTGVDRPFEGASAFNVITLASAGLHAASETFELPVLGRPPLAVSGAEFEQVSLGHLPNALLDSLAAALPATPAEIVGVGFSRHEPVATLSVRMLTFDRQTGILRRYSQFDADVRLNAVVPEVLPKSGLDDVSPHLAVTRSVLADGTWYKFPVSDDGIYRIDAAYLSALGVSPQAVDPARVRIFGNGGRPLPARNSDTRPADLVEQPVFASHDGDTIFEEGEYILFYAEDVQSWTFDEQRQDWAHVTNPFSLQNYYFIQTDGPPGARIETATWPGLVNPDVVSEVEARLLVDDEVIHLEQDGSGSGLEWFGTLVDTEVPVRAILDVTPAGLVSGTVRYRSRIAVRSNPPATMQFESGGAVLAAVRPGVVGLGAGSELGFMARPAVVDFDQPTPTGGRLQLDLRLLGQTNAPSGWLDWLEVYYPRALEAEDGVLRFASTPVMGGSVEFQLSGFASEPHVWEITEVGKFRRLAVQPSGASWSVQIDGDPSAREFVAFEPAGPSIAAPEPGDRVDNQNLHGIATFPDFVIVVPTELKPVADDLAARRRAEGLTVTVTELDEITNEFSGGVKDMRSIRDYFRFLYDRGRQGDRELKYALLLGDGHFDFREITDDPESPLNPNLVFTYQTDNTLWKGASYTSDDYFGLLDANEGVWEWTGDSGITFERMDIGIGRWPVESLEEARLMLSKLEQYESQDTQGAWRTRYVFVADDGPAGSSDDKDLHTQNADVVAEAVT